MARSFIDPSLVAMALEPSAPPWDWNPGATFTRAYNDAQAIQLKREEIENERQIMEILLPYKVKKAALDLDELRSDMKVNEATVDIRRKELEYRNRALEEEVKSRNRPRAIFNPSTGVFEPADTGGASSSNFGTDADTPLPPMRSEGESTIFDDLEDTDLTSGLSYRVTDQTRDQLGQKSTAKNRQVSLDFNAGGDASTRGVEIVIPSDATPEERAAAEAYTTKLTDWFASKGVKVPNRGVLTKTGKGGSVNRFHTEPFFVQDAEARAAIESDPDGYASVLAGTLGRLPVTFIPPHTSKDPGAADGDINERDFARNTIIPALRRLQEGGSRSAQTASRSTRNPLVDDEDGFNNPLARLDEEAIVPIGAQYTGGETNVASGRFDASLEREEATSPVQEMGFDLGRFSASIPDEEQVPEDERIVREIQSRRQAFEQNIYDMERQGFQIAPEELDRASVKIEREARAKLLPFVNKLGEAGMESMKTLIDGKEPFESAYAIAKRSVAAADPERVGPVAPDNPQLKAALDNKKTYRSTLPEDPTTWTDEEREAVAAFDRTIQVLTAVPKRSLLQDVVATKAELEGMTQALNQRRPFAKTNPNGTYDVIPMEQLEGLAGETKQRLDALVPRLRETEDPDLFNPLRYKTEDEMTKAKAETLERNPNAFVITPKGELSYLRNFNARRQEAEQAEPEQSEMENMTPEERERMMTERIKRAAGTVGPMIKRAGGALLRGARAIR
jgi:hypothetical protein